MRFKLFKNKEKTRINNVLKSQKTQEKSRGRSMVEMLGVLAVIGVLSIGGIQGYTIAMRKHRANEILNELQKYAVTYYTGAQQKLLNDEAGIDSGYWYLLERGEVHSEDVVSIPGISNYVKTRIKSTVSGDFVLLTLDLNDKQLCEMLANTTGDKVWDTDVNDIIKPGVPCSDGFLFVSFLMS